MTDNKISCRTRILNVLRSLASSDGSHPTALPDLQIVRKSSIPSTRHITDVARICYVVQGAKAIFQDGRRFVYDADNLLVLPLSVPLAGEIVSAKPSRPMLSASIALNIEELSEVLRLLPPARTRLFGMESYIPVQPINGTLLCTLSRYISLLNEPEAIPALAPGLRRELHYRMLTSAAGASLRAIVKSRVEASRIGKALVWFRHRAFEPVSMRKLADIANMSEPAMFKAFKQLTSMSPVQYQKQVRLQEARRLLLAGQGDISLVSARVGYNSLSQFSREYRRLFQASPKRDIANLMAQETS